MAPKFKTTKKRLEYATLAGSNGDNDNNSLISEKLQQQQQHQQPHLQQQQQQQPQPQQQQQQQQQINGDDFIIKNINSDNATQNATPEISDDIGNRFINHHPDDTSIEPTQGSQIPATPSPMPPPSQTSSIHTASSHKETFYSYKATPAASTFTWESYLKMRPAKVAPKEAFRQALVLPKNQFEIGMKLEAKDPRNSSNWCLASVIFVEGLHLRLRFVGADSMNDLYELIDSENIRPVGSSPSDLLLAPTGFTGNIAQYPKYVEKVLRSETTIIAPPEYFPPTPPKPEKNLFERGMKLEAVDLKNRDFICPATIGAVDGNKLLIVFDGWKGSFDYRCDYFSRDIFPINWCRDTERAIQPPNGWNAMLESGVLPPWSPSVTPDFGASQASSTFNGFSRRGSEKVTNSQTSTKKQRGRPKGDSTKIQNKIPKEKLKTSKPISSTPKKQPPPEQNHIQESSMTPSPHAPDGGVITKTDLSDDGLGNDRFQCQRTVSYNEWQKRKLEDQMPRVEFSNDVEDIGDTSLNLSDTTSMASTLSSTNQKDLTELSEQGGCPKRPRMDTDDVSITEKLRQLLETKPSKLSQWTVEDVLDIIKTENSLVKYTETFLENEIDGKAFGLFDERRRDLLMSMGLKLGPVLKVLNLREQISVHVDTSDIVLR